MAAFVHKGVVGAALDDLAIFDHHDSVRVPNGREAVRDDDHGNPATLDHRIDGRLHLELTLGVEGAAVLFIHSFICIRIREREHTHP